MDTKNALVVQQSLPITTLAELQKTGEILSQTKMLGCANPAEGFILAATCYQEKISFLDFKRRYHIMMGEISQKSESMLADFRRLGGKYTIKSRTPDKVEIFFSCDGAEYTETVLWEDLQHEAYTRAGRDEKGNYYNEKTPIEQRRFKDNYSTPRRRMQMMWARAVSDGVRTVCPEVTQGAYTPEEIQDFAPAVESTPIQVSQQNVEQEIVPIEQIEQLEHSKQIETIAKENIDVLVPTSQEQLKEDNASITVLPPPPLPLTPFEMCQSESGNSDPEICPIGEHKGKSWHSIPEQFLKILLASAFTPGITQAHREAIIKSINERRVQK